MSPMALCFDGEGKEEEGSVWKRKRKRMKRRFHLHEQVEVRSEEDGFLGSWHQGKVIACYGEGWHVTYDVRYDHILDEDGTDHLVDRVRVSLRANGINSANVDRCNYRGYIRPLPPPLEFGKFGLPYGMCVDVYHMECWWEGVIFDHEDGLDQRKIFFPDLGDEMIIDIDKVRITQDWNEITEVWQRRGMWLFLELIEEYEKEYCIPVSIKQLWYDLREKEEFVKLGEWISSLKSLWKELLLEAICDNLKVIVGHHFNLIDLPKKTPRQLEYPKQVNDVNINFETDLAEACTIIPIENKLSGNMLSFPLMDDPNMNCLTKSKTFCDDKVVCALPQPLSSKTDGMSIINEEGSSGSNSNKINVKHSSSMCNRTDWKLAGPDTVLGAEKCPEAIIRYIQKHNKMWNTVIIAAVRKHLLYLKWKIEFMKYGKNDIRFRYTSPGGKLYYSLRQVCLDLSKSDVGNNVCIDSHESGLGDSSSFLNEQALENRDPKFSSQAVVSFCSGELDIEPEYCPQALADWYKYGYEERFNGKINKTDADHMKLRVRKHLSYLGWVFWYAKFKGRRELRYGSPTGRCYGSLRRACEDAMNERTSGGSVSSYRHIKRKNFKKRSQLKRVLLSSKRVQQVLTPHPSHHNPRTVLCWLIENNVILPRAKVHYGSGNDSHPVKEGRITRDGIKCSCCAKVYTLSGFEVHAGGKHCRAAANIFLEDGRSLLTCQMQIVRDRDKKNNFLKQQPDKSNDSWHQGENDCVCSVCHYGGELILCDQCPSSFHQSCLGMKDVPSGDWFCPSCCCRICGHSKLKEDTKSSVDNRVLSCTQCQRKYHTECLRKRMEDRPEFVPKQNWFCSRKCEMIFSGLHELTGKAIPVGVVNLTWTLLKSVQPDGDASTIEDFAESYSKINIALDVMHECFEQVEEPHSRRDLVRDVIFSKRSELNRLNFQGFYTILLEKNDEIISVATVRVYGEQVAEIPLICTRFQYRRLGMCRILMKALEKKLMELGVQRLVLPAVPSVLNTWTNSFGFSKMSDSERLQFVDYNFLDFQDTVMCHKLLMGIPSTESIPSKETQPIVLDDTYENGDYVDLDGSSTVSDILQADQIEEGGIVEQGLADLSAGSSDNVIKGSINLGNKAIQPECEPCVSEISLECLVEESAFKTESWNRGNGSMSSNKESGDRILKRYKRRRY